MRFLITVVASFLLVVGLTAHMPIPEEEATSVINFAPGAADHSDPWRFIVMSDIHNAEEYVQKNGSPVNHQNDRLPLRATQAAVYSGIRNAFGGEIVMIPGDLFNGRWQRAAFRNGMGDGSLSLGNAIKKYMGWGLNNPRIAYLDAGYDNLMIAVGDHEVGDNDWPAGVKANAVRFYKEQFGVEVIGKSVEPFYEARNGSLAAHEGTSYAVRHNNAVLITLDQFHQASTTQVIGRHGTVEGELSPSLLAWLEDVLIAANADAGVERIIVQGHLPVLQPVRAQSSSTMAFKGGADSPMWQLFRQYGVDLYLCGEVHANSVIADPGGPVQIASRGFRDYSMAAIVDVEVDGISAFVVDSELDTIGTVSIPDAGPVAGTGIFTPIDMNEPLLVWEPVPVSTGSIIRFENTGEFAPHFSSSCDDCVVTPTPGILVGNASGVIFDHVPTAFRNGHETTIEIAFKASQHERGVLMSVLRSGANHLGKGFAVVQFHNRLEFFMDGKKATAPFAFTPGVDHVLRISHETGGRLRGLSVEIDGNPLTVSGQNPEVYVIGAQYNISLGGAGNQGWSFNSAYNYARFRSEIYSLKIWGRALAP